MILRTAFRITGLALVLLPILATASSAADGKRITIELNSVPVRTALQMLWAQGGPADTTFKIDDSVPEDITVTLSARNVPFDTVLDSLCNGTGLAYRVARGTYFFQKTEGRADKIVITRFGDNLNWDLVNADPLEAARQLLSVFEKRSDQDVAADPTVELTEAARRYAQDLLQISQISPSEQAARLKDLKKEVQKYLKPPKDPVGARRTLTIKESNTSFSEAMDKVGEAAGFLWFRRADGRIALRRTTSADAVKRIFLKEGIFDALSR